METFVLKCARRMRADWTGPLHRRRLGSVARVPAVRTPLTVLIVVLACAVVIIIYTTIASWSGCLATGCQWWVWARFLVVFRVLLALRRRDRCICVFISAAVRTQAVYSLECSQKSVFKWVLSGTFGNDRWKMSWTYDWQRSGRRWAILRRPAAHLSIGRNGGAHAIAVGDDF